MIIITSVYTPVFFFYLLKNRRALWFGLDEGGIICQMFELNEMENEHNSVLYCPFYWRVREKVLNNIDLA